MISSRVTHYDVIIYDIFLVLFKVYKQHDIFLLKCQVDIVPVIKLGKITKLSKLLTLFLQNSGSEKSRLIWQGLI